MSCLQMHEDPGEVHQVRRDGRLSEGRDPRGNDPHCGGSGTLDNATGEKPEGLSPAYVGSSVIGSDSTTEYAEPQPAIGLAAHVCRRRPADGAGVPVDQHLPAEHAHEEQVILRRQDQG